MADEVQTNYYTKKIKFFNRSIQILLQSNNGPCPLLAICNCLLLNGSIQIHEDLAAVDQEQLVNLVANRLIETNPTVEGEHEAMSENRQTQLNDAISLLPILQRGLDVNVKFGTDDIKTSAVMAFEYTREFSPFDLLGLDLVHGWLADPQDTETYHILSKLTYNHAVEKLISFRSSSHASNSPEPSSLEAQAPEPSSLEAEDTSNSPQAPEPSSLEAEDSTSIVLLPPLRESEVLPVFSFPLNVDEANPIASGDSLELISETSPPPDISELQIKIPEECVGVLIGRGGETIRRLHQETGTLIQLFPNGDGEGMRQVGLKGPNCSLTAAKIMDLVNDISQEVNVLVNDKEDEGGGGGDDGGVGEAVPDIVNSLVTPSILDPPLDISEVDSSEKDKEQEDEQEQEEKSKSVDAEEGLIIDRFMHASASQLTYHGLLELHQHLRERQVAIFFRNCHFCTIFKYQGMLYLLVTDEGYRDEEEVVWEKLDEIDGDTEYCNAQFLASQTTVSHPSAAATPPSPPLTKDLVDPDFLLAMQLSNGGESAENGGEEIIPMVEGKLVTPSVNAVTPALSPSSSLTKVLEAQSVQVLPSAAASVTSGPPPTYGESSHIPDSDENYARLLQQQLNEASGPPSYRTAVAPARNPANMTADEEYAFVLQQQMDMNDEEISRLSREEKQQTRRRREVEEARGKREKKEGGCSIQ